jgi:hypothetical protein
MKGGQRKMKSEKKKKKSDNKKIPKEKMGKEKPKKVNRYEEGLEDFVHAISLINTIEAHWDNQEIILSFSKREKMIPFMFLTNCVFASKNCHPEQIDRS